MFEKRWAAVSPQLFTSNGTANGKLTVLDSSVFKVKQQVNLSATTLPNLNLEVKSIPDDTTILVGPLSANIFTYSDISAYTVALGANIWAIEQKRSSVPVEEINRAVYEEEPVVAERVILIDKHGNKYDENNPLPVNASVEVIVPPVTVDIDAMTPPNRTDPDNVLIVGSEDGTKAGLKHAARVDSELDLRVGISDGANKAAVDNTGQLSVSDATSQGLLSDILTTVSGTGNNLTIGTENGQVSGTQRVFVNNLRLQVLDSHDRIADFSYADFGTKNQRITRVEYSSPTFPGIVVRRDFSYTLVGNNYRRDDEIWTII